MRLRSWQPKAAPTRPWSEAAFSARRASHRQVCYNFTYLPISPRSLSTTSMRAILSFLALALAASATAATSDWPQFRGPTGQGIAADSRLPLHWSETEGVVWKSPVPGRGWSSPVVAEGKVWLTTAEVTPLTGDEEAAMRKKLASQPLGDAMSGVAEVALSAVEIDVATGAVTQQVKLFDVSHPAPIHGLNSFASPTPILQNGRCYCHFGTYGTACINTVTGKVLWRAKFEIDHIVGPGSSPELVDDLLVIPCDGGDKQFIVALDVETGDVCWKTDRPPLRESNPDQKKAFSTPLAIDVAGGRLVVVPGAQWFTAYDADTGDEVWRVDHGSGFSNVPRPIFDGRRVYLTTGFIRPQLWALRADGIGDVSESHVSWRSSQLAPTMSSPVLHEGRIYMVNDGGVASCLDAETGKKLWTHRVSGKYSASPLYGAGRIYFCSHEGLTTVIAATDKFEELAENQLDGQLMASPATVDGDLLLRSDSHLYRIHGAD